LTRQRVVAAALALVDRDGLGGLTMRALGRDLGVDPMAVYHYLPSKDTLLDAIVEAVWAELRLPPETGVWQHDLDALARAVRAVLLAHPAALPVVATRQNVGDAGLRLLDRGIGILARAGIPPGEALHLMAAASAYLVGHALAQVGRAPGGAEDVPVEAFVAAVGADPDGCGHLQAALAEGVPELDAVFEHGLALLVAGTAGRVEAGRSR
jgi:TetR/AcrR family transcriptional regulator, tetracycline repressor protein